MTQEEKKELKEKLKGKNIHEYMEDLYKEGIEVLLEAELDEHLGYAKNEITLDFLLSQSKYIPEEKIHVAHHWLILHGRYVCQARKPKCQECGISDFCKFYHHQNKIIKTHD